MKYFSYTVLQYSLLWSSQSIINRLYVHVSGFTNLGIILLKEQNLMSLPTSSQSEMYHKFQAHILVTLYLITGIPKLDKWEFRL
jgi:hypothetical protein